MTFVEDLGTSTSPNASEHWWYLGGRALEEKLANSGMRVAEESKVGSRGRTRGHVWPFGVAGR